MSETKVPERIWVWEDSGSGWRYGGWDLSGQSDTFNRAEYVRAEPFPALGASAMREAAVAIAKRYKDAALTRCDASEDRGEQATDGDENTANTAGSIEHYIRALPLPDRAALLAEALRLPEVKALVDALKKAQQAIADTLPMMNADAFTIGVLQNKVVRLLAAGRMFVAGYEGQSDLIIKAYYAMKSELEE